jgi:hypothetical protein
VPDPLKTISGLVVAFIVISLYFFVAPEPLADSTGANTIAASRLADGKTAGILRQTSGKTSGKYLRVAQLAGDAWIVKQVSGPVSLDGTGRAVAAGDRLATGDRVVTGPGGRAVITRRKDSITMSQNSDMKVGDSQGNRLFTNILQKIGTLLFQVETNPNQRF